MNKAYRLVLALCASAAMLSSCSRANYSFNNSVPAYLGSQPARSVAVAPTPAAQSAPVAEAPSPTAEAVKPAVAAAPVATPAPKAATRKQQLVAEVTKRVAAARTAVTTTTTPARHSLAQRLMANKIVKQLGHQNSAHTTARVGTSLVVLLVGLVIGIVGAIVNSGAIGVIGGVVFIIGVILLILALLD